MEIVIPIVLCLIIVPLFLLVRRGKSNESPLAAVIPMSASLSRSESVSPAAPASVGLDTVEVLAEEDSAAEDEADIPVTQDSTLIARLHKVFEEEKVFLRPDIRIDDVARMLMTNRTYITRLMRQEYGLSFMEYVNVARVQYSQQLLYSYDLTLDEVAEKSGFMSSSNYCRVFKRIVGVSPHVWIESVKRKRRK